MNRTDQHRPSADDFDPAHYAFVGVVVFKGKAPKSTELREALLSKQAAQGRSLAPHQQDGKCGHCGARLVYAALMVHRPTNEMIYVGEQCLEGRFAGTKTEFQTARKREQQARAASRTKDTLAENIADATARNWLLEVFGHKDAVLALDLDVRGFALSLMRQMPKRPLTDRQVEAFASALDRSRAKADEAKEREARWAKEREESIPVPSGKTRVCGVVRSVKEELDNYSPNGGYVTKIVVRDHRGFTVMGTAPRALLRMVDYDLDSLKGTDVEFSATLRQGNKDEFFGFFARASMAVLATPIINLEESS